MRRLGLFLMAAIPALAAASYAEAQSPGASNFSGFYAGINAGAGQATDNIFFNTFGTTSAPFAKGGMIGGQAGYNAQFGNFLLGVDTSWDWSRIEGDTSCPNASFRCATNTKDLFLVTGRTGIVVGSTLAYAKGGYASANVSSSATPALGGFSFEGRRDGWAWGGGLEWKFAPSMTFGVDYTHVDLNNKTFDGGANGPVTSHPKIDAVMARVNFLFGGREEYRPLK